jgi:ribosomal protein L37AE/L43A
VDIRQKKNLNQNPAQTAVRRTWINRFTVSSAVKNSSFCIDYQCPQCGAPAVLDETDRLFSCEYCRVKSYLITKDYFRYTLPSKAPENKNLLYFPYWRFKGMLFSCISDGARQKFIDVSHQAVNSPFFPMTVGWRSQALKLKFVTPDTEGRFIEPDQSLENIIRIFENRFQGSLPQTVFHQAHIGESLSLIYSPFYVNSRVYDAVLNEPVSSFLPDDFNESNFAGGRPEWQIDFLPTLCPDCGWDMDGRRDSVVLVCKNCESIWQPDENEFKKIKFAYIEEKEKDIIYLPFWRIRADVSEIELKSYADLVKIANLTKFNKQNFDMKFSFWSPAFKIRPQTFLPLVKKMTLFQPQDKLIYKLPDIELYPVTLPFSEAAETLKINLASFIKPQKIMLPKLSEIKVQPRSFLLVYVPFIEKHHELIGLASNFTITKNQLKMARNL